MSNFEPLSTQSDWREQYSPFPINGENSLPPSFEQSTAPDAPNVDSLQQPSRARLTLEQRHSLGPLRQGSQPPLTIERPGSASGDYGNQTNDTPRDGALVSAESVGFSHGSLGSSSLSSVSRAPVLQVTVETDDGDNLNAELKEEDDEDDDDDDMLDVEEGAVPQTAAERRAERRKMKRFRLTHQQTRFLMSEFAKQAHPDAAHRERLSREIPGLSPRQVQVWFQNRRAKIKRLTADDRERMMKMRAVPEGFDNVQALHSPYGAVHAIGTPMQSPVDFTPSYADHMMRPLMVDTMRREGNGEHMSPTGLGPAFGHVGFAPQTSLSSADVLSPSSMNSSDRYYPSHLSSPVSTGPRNAISFDRHNSYQSLSHARQQSRPLQPLQLRDTMSRTKSESLQSPLRSSMSWKGETLDYASYQTGQSSPQMSGRQHSLYQSDQIGNSAVNAHQYESNAYPSSNQNLHTSPPSLAYSPSHGGASATLHRSSPSAMSRLRASSGAFPPGLDLRNQYRGLGSQNNHGLATPRSSSFASTFTTGYASAPLAAPVEFSMPRTPNDASPSQREFTIPLSSAPMAPPQDFSHAYNSNVSPVQGQQEQREYGNQTQNSGESTTQGQSQGVEQPQHQHNRRDEDSAYLRPCEYETGQKRKRSFAMPGEYESP